MLPIMTVDSMDDAIDFVNRGEKPLAMYVFTESRSTFERISKLTSAGGVTHNDTLLHAGGEEVCVCGVGACVCESVCGGVRCVYERVCVEVRCV